MTVYNYVEQFRTELQQKYARELTSHDLFLSNPQVTFMNAQTIKLPNITVSGYKDHSRATTGYNSGNLSNEWEPKKLEHDRDIEFAIDPMDVDETNLILSMANIQNTLETEQGIPEKDSYVYSKLYQEATNYASNGATVATDELTAENILTLFDDAMEKMDEASVPAEGRVLYVTPAVNKLFKQAKDLQRVLGVTGGEFFALLDAKDPIVFWNNGVKHMQVSQATFDNFQSKSNVGKLDDETVNKLVNGITGK